MAYGKGTFELNGPRTCPDNLMASATRLERPAMKNLFRRLKISGKRLRRCFRKDPLLMGTEASLIALSFVTLLAMGWSSSVRIENVSFWLHMAAILGFWALWITLYFLGSRERREALAKRLKWGLFAILGSIALLHLPSIALSYFMAFPDLSEQLETDAYLQEHAEPMARGVDHFVKMVADDKIYVISHDGEESRMSIPDRLSFKMLYRLPLALKSWAGEITPEEARRHFFWHNGDRESHWSVLVENVLVNSLPTNATHPGIGLLTCAETRHGRLLVSPWFVGVPSEDTSHPAFDAHPEHLVRPDGKPGMIQVPAPAFFLDVSDIEYMKPLVEICRDKRPNAATE